MVAAGASEPVRVLVLGSLVDARPGFPAPPGGTAARLMAAGNEFESFQVAVVSGGGAVGAVSIARDGPLVGPGGRIPARNVSVYREAYYDVRAPSDREGAPGLWPDPLIPSRDDLYGERRDAFPVGVPAGGQAVAWVDVLVPPHQAPGEYRGRVAVDLGGGTREVAVRLRVLPFSLPSTASLRSAFTLRSLAACEGLHPGESCMADSKRAWVDHYLFSRVALDDRLTIADPLPTGASTPPPSGAQRRLFRRYALPLIDGSRSSAVGGPPPRLRGARLTAVEADGATYAAGGGTAAYGCAFTRPPCLASWQTLASRYGFARRFLVYLCDEPWLAPSSRWPACERAAAYIRRGGWAGVPRLVTTWIQATHGRRERAIVDTMAVPVERMAGRPGYPQAGDQRPAYAGFLHRRGHSLWLYTYCDQYSCGRSRSPYWVGWPGYGIDQPSSQARAMGWLAFDYGASGELYYSVASLLQTAWSNSYQFGGNGDGTLFYPGLPAGDPARGAPPIGGTHPIPIESIRLKRIRDGREDYEYLRLAAARGDRARAEAIVRRLLGPRSRATYSTTFSQHAVDQARCRLARLLDSSLRSCS